MARNKTSKYWGVSATTQKADINGNFEWAKDHPWRCFIKLPTTSVNKYFSTEREAAIYADMINLEHRLGKPLNILKPKQ